MCPSKTFSIKNLHRLEIYQTMRPSLISVCFESSCTRSSCVGRDCQEREEKRRYVMYGLISQRRRKKARRRAVPRNKSTRVRAPVHFPPLLSTIPFDKSLAPSRDSLATPRRNPFQQHYSSTDTRMQVLQRRFSDTNASACRWGLCEIPWTDIDDGRCDLKGITSARNASVNYKMSLSERGLCQEKTVTSLMQQCYELSMHD